MLMLEEILDGHRLEETRVVDRLQILIAEFVEQAKRDGIHVRGFSAERPLETVFTKFPVEKQMGIYQGFKRYYDVLSGASKEGIPLSEGPRLLWRMLSKLNLHPCAEFFDKVHSEDVIEIYDRDLMQIFRNLKFLELCNYSLDQIFSYEVTELFSRPEAATMQMLHSVQGVLDGTHQKTVAAKIPVHVLEETRTPEKGKFRIEHGFLSPLRDSSNRVVCFISTLKATPIAESSV
jgi:hypothetical protein